MHIAQLLSITGGRGAADIPQLLHSQHPALAVGESAQAKISGAIEMVTDDVIIPAQGATQHPETCRF